MTADNLDSLDLDVTAAGAVPNAARSLGDEATFGDAPRGEPASSSMASGVLLADRYRVEGTLGRGGMGEVVEAVDTVLDRRVAVKRLRAGLCENDTAIGRFRDEARAVAALNHFHIVQLYDYGTDADGPFLVMEFVDGPSLCQRLAGEPVPWERAVEWTCRLCDALGFAHDRGIVHRDVKPANVLLTSDEQPKLADFGLARQLEAIDGERTRAGAVLGTLDFMAPEQRRNPSAADARSDLWSLAATLYQMVTGSSPRVVRLDRVPEPIRDVLATALAEDPDARHPSAEAFRDALLPFARMVSTPIPQLLEVGRCPSCGTRNAESNRICRGCGTSLRTTCPACEIELPTWERFCQQCGADQPESIEARNRELSELRGEAERLRAEFRYSDAVATARLFASRVHPRCEAEVGWVEEFTAQAESEAEEAGRRADETLLAAESQLADGDHRLAVELLEGLPDAVLLGDATGARRSQRDQLLERARAASTSEADEVRTLRASIGAAVREQRLDHLWSDVDRYCRLAPDDPKAAKLREQLASRYRKARERPLATARDRAAAHDAPGVLSALADLPDGPPDREADELRHWAESITRTPPAPPVANTVDWTNVREWPAWAVSSAVAAIVLVLVLLAASMSGNTNGGSGTVPGASPFQPSNPTPRRPPFPGVR